MIFFEDEFSYISRFTKSEARQNFGQWSKALREERAKVCVLEIGCGSVIRSSRNRGDSTLRGNPNATRIRLNLYEHQCTIDADREVGISLPAKDGMERMIKALDLM